MTRQFGCPLNTLTCFVFQARQIYLSKALSTEVKHKLSKTKWKSVVGLEVHAQIATNSKLFSGSATEYALPVNSGVSLFDAAIPGTLPVLNRKCVEAGVKTALALSCCINPISVFDRKHYFYSDLPAGYQITQQRMPLAQEGYLTFEVFTPGIHKYPYTKTSHIIQLQLEQDSGKSLHDLEFNRSLIDLNRAGVPLMEIVFEPDLSDGEEAAALVQELILILQRLGTCSGKMSEGALRIDANISVHCEGEPFGVRTEIKNIASIRALANAVQYEIIRQKKEIESGNLIVNETRSWDADNKKTVSMRDKEDKQDYRFMPEPNLPPLHLLIDGYELPKDVNPKDVVNVECIRKEIPEMPQETRKMLKDKFGLSSQTAVILVAEPKLLDYFTQIIEANDQRNSKSVSNILIMDLLTALHKNNLSLEECTLPSTFLGEIVDMLQNGDINANIARQILHDLANGNCQTPREMVKLHGWSMITEEKKIRQICLDIVNENPKLVHEYRSGKKKVFKAFLGKIAQSTNGIVNMALVSEELKKMLEKN